MVFSKNCQFRFLKCGALLIFICVTINLQYGFVGAATLSKSRSGNVRVKESCQSFCQHPICTDQATFFSNIMDESVNPCDDFYQFVCGNFIKKIKLSNKFDAANIFGAVQYNVDSVLHNSIKEEINPSELDAFKKYKIFYQNCMNKSHIEEKGAKSIFQLLKSMGGWPILLGHNWNENDFNWEEVVYKINQKKFEVFFPVTLNVVVDKDNSSKTILTINSAATINQAFLANNNDLSVYHRLIIKSAVALGANEDRILAETKELLNFEINLLNIKMSEEQAADEKATTNRITVKELSENHPSIPWLDFINKILEPSGVLIDEAEIINVNDPQFIFQIEKLLKFTPKRVLANFLAWRVIITLLPYEPYFQEILAELTESNVSKTQESQKLKESECLKATMESFPIALSAVYIRKYFNREIKKQSYELIQNIKNQIKMNFKEVNWMDEETKKAALEKLDAMGVFVGYTDELMDDEKVNGYYNDLEMKPDVYWKSILNFKAFEANKNYASLKTSVDKNNWTLYSSSIIVNAFYRFQLNAIEIPAAILGNYFYQIDRPQYLNYGALGNIIGHEIIHGFDHTGRTIDKNGNRKNWWQPDTSEKYTQKVQCIIDQYNNFTVEEVGLQVNGVRTQGENIADIGGFKAAYQAYNKWVNRNNIVESCLPKMDYTQRQLFWISTASVWCAMQKPNVLENFMHTDAHSPNNARIIVTLSNIKEFAEDFQCKPGSRMNPEKKCVLW